MSKMLDVKQIVLSCGLTAVMPDCWQLGWSTWLEDMVRKLEGQSWTLSYGMCDHGPWDVEDTGCEVDSAEL